MRKVEGHLRTLALIAARTKLWPPTLERLAKEVAIIHGTAFDPEFYAFSHLDGKLISPFWHYVLIGRNKGLDIAPRALGVFLRTVPVSYVRQTDGPAFSVIMPTRNRRRVLKRAIESVLSQSEQDFELLIVDDGSIDGTSSWLRNHYAVDLFGGRIRLINGLGEGASAARNRALKVARGRWIAYLDSDNYWTFQHLALHKAALQAGAQVVFSRAVGSSRVPSVYDRTIHLQRTVADMNGLSHERALTELLGGFDSRLARYEDYDLMLRLCRSFRPTILAEETFVYLIQRDSLSVRAPAEPSRKRLYANHALERVLTGLEHRRITISKSLAPSHFGDLVSYLGILSCPCSPEMFFAAPSDPLPSSSDAVVYVIGEPNETPPSCVAAFVSDRGPLYAPRITPKELLQLVLPPDAVPKAQQF